MSGKNINLYFEDALLASVDDFRFGNRIASRADAIRRLIVVGLGSPVDAVVVAKTAPIDPTPVDKKPVGRPRKASNAPPVAEPVAAPTPAVIPEPAAPPPAPVQKLMPYAQPIPDDYKPGDIDPVRLQYTTFNFVQGRIDKLDDGEEALLLDAVLGRSKTMVPENVHNLKESIEATWNYEWVVLMNALAESAGAEDRFTARVGERRVFEGVKA